MKPTGVGIKHPDGSFTPVELEHDGKDENGIDQWVYPESVEFGPGDEPFIGMLPGKTGIRFPILKPTNAND